MYVYTEFDTQFVRQRAAQFRDQLERNLAGRLSDDDFRALRLQNGWYIQRHAPMARIAVPYGELSSRQLRVANRWVVSTSSRRSTILIRSCRLSTVSSSATSTAAWSRMVPVSTPESTRKTLAPVTFTP